MSINVTINGATVALPDGAVAYKYADPIEDARWIYDEAEAEAIEREDPSLIAMSSKGRNECLKSRSMIRKHFGNAALTAGPGIGCQETGAQSR